MALIDCMSRESCLQESRIKVTYSLENMGSPPWCLPKLGGIWSSIAQELDMLVKRFRYQFLFLEMGRCDFCSVDLPITVRRKVKLKEL
jgi:hypothetical protein